ncbi:RecA-superfamily ATPase possibly involved in signal transduction [Candidatus Methanoperedens nitroreducens]|uniref:RecA-superfamily ATPase possibly involved in signal transduction n=1 Tax=Candidatus Methanoperedens nitratireducens TaxID=1392998 RepID=A0A062V9U7_9EURY|nr:ATPase domain-containing protein [Candidatus Methanoperedens nitroreducens]KCZ72489.1 RecA-superfamily ATPase possibly involved in signal transduction [Candidatus Methanoperedens nitroreducens]MDJ1423577.1 ATPase domain-containing protein [Candidatus Methanoperedens sp.]
MSDYILGIKELDNAIGGIKKGSNIMLIGPPMSGKEVILYYIMYQGVKNDNAIITVTTRESATHILEWFKEHELDMPLSRVGMVDCVTKTFVGTVVESENIKIASSPVDLTGIGVKISQFLEEYFMKKNIRKVQLHINSLSTILMYSNIQTVFRFLHVFTGRIKAMGAMGIYVIESGMHDEQAIATLKQLLDGVIEIKSEDDKNFIRIVGLSTKPTPWFEYEIEGANVRIVGRK